MFRRNVSEWRGTPELYGLPSTGVSIRLLDIHPQVSLLLLCSGKGRDHFNLARWSVQSGGIVSTTHDRTTAVVLFYFGAINCMCTLRTHGRLGQIRTRSQILLRIRTYNIIWRKEQRNRVERAEVFCCCRCSDAAAAACVWKGSGSGTANGLWWVTL